MSTATLNPPASRHRNVCLYMRGEALFSPSHEFVDGENGSRILKVTGMPVFRSGTFKDSSGEQNTWESLHIDQMVLHYNHLRDNNSFPDVPVRRGHGSFFGDPMSGLIGYHDKLYSQDVTVGDKTYKYLVADFSIHDKKAQDNFLNNLYRNRSAEIGHFETNDEAEFWPVYQGFAFVDIPAVENLNLFEKDRKRDFRVLLEDDREFGMSGTTAVADPDGAVIDEEETPEVEASAPEGSGNAPAPAPVENSADDEDDDDEIPVGDCGDFSRRPAFAHFRFKCADGVTRGPVEFGSYITNLESEVVSLRAFRSEQTAIGRENFVKQLATDKKISAPQIPALTEYAKGLSDDQYLKWSKTYDAAPQLPIFGQFAGSSGVAPEEQEKSADEKEWDQVVAQVQWHRASAMLESNLQNTQSYKRMVALADKLGKEKV